VYDDMMLGVNQEYQRACKWCTQVASGASQYFWDAFSRCSDATARWARRTGFPIIKTPLRIRGVASSLNKRLPRNRSNAGLPGASTGARAAKAGMSTRRGAAAAAAANANVKKTGDSVLLPLLFRIKLADQDSLADLTSLLAVPSLITVFAIFAMHGQSASTVGMAVGSGAHAQQQQQHKPQHEGTSLFYGGERLELWNLWLRFGLMFLARLLSCRVSRAVFSHKIRYYRLTLLNESHNVDLLRDEVQQRLWTRVLMSSRDGFKGALDICNNTRSSSGGSGGSGDGSVTQGPQDELNDAHFSCSDNVVVTRSGRRTRMAGGKQHSAGLAMHGRRQVHQSQHRLTQQQQEQEQEQQLQTDVSSRLRRHGARSEDFGASEMMRSSGAVVVVDEVRCATAEGAREVVGGRRGRGGSKIQVKVDSDEQNDQHSNDSEDDNDDDGDGQVVGGRGGESEADNGLGVPGMGMGACGVVPVHTMPHSHLTLDEGRRSGVGGSNSSSSPRTHLASPESPGQLDSSCGSSEAFTGSATSYAGLVGCVGVASKTDRQLLHQQQQHYEASNNSFVVGGSRDAAMSGGIRVGSGSRYPSHSAAASVRLGSGATSTSPKAMLVEHGTQHEQQQQQNQQQQQQHNQQEREQHQQQQQQQQQQHRILQHHNQQEREQRQQTHHRPLMTQQVQRFGTTSSSPTGDESGASWAFLVSDDDSTDEDDSYDHHHVSHHQQEDTACQPGGGVTTNEFAADADARDLEAGLRPSAKSAAAAAASGAGGASSVTSLHEATVVEFRTCFWYFCLVTISCAFSCFQHPDMPTRFTFCA
jgi:hypothetical protein